MNNDYQSMSVAELEQYAEDNGIYIPGMATKTNMIQLIEHRELSQMTDSELADYAKQNEIEIPPESSKEEIVHLIIDAKMGEKELEQDAVKKYAELTKSGRTRLRWAKGYLGSKSHRTQHTLTVYTICSNCGEELYATLHVETDTKSVKEIGFKSPFGQCPVCGARLGLREGKYIERYDTKNHNNAFKELHLIEDSKEKEKYSNEVSSTITKIKAPKDLTADNSAARHVLASEKLLKEYLLYLIHMESETYLLTERIAALQQQILANERGAARGRGIIKAVKADLEKELNDKLSKITDEVSDIKSKLKNEEKLVDPTSVVVSPDDIGMTRPQKSKMKKPIKPIEPQKPTFTKPLPPSEPNYKKPGLFNKKKVTNENDDLKNRYQTELSLYNQALVQYHAAQEDFASKTAAYKDDMAEYQRLTLEYQSAKEQYAHEIKAYDKAYEEAHNKVIALNLARVKQELQKKLDSLTLMPRFVEREVFSKEGQLVESFPQENIISMLKEEQKYLEKELKMIVKARNELYSYNIIYGKYRNYVALTTLYEYLDSGRCSALDGPDGAYNLLETEARANEIIMQLSTIATSLETIKANQFMMYKELKQANQFLSSIDKSMKAAVIEMQELDMTAKEMTSLFSSINNATQESNEVLFDIADSANDIREASIAVTKNTSRTANNTAATAQNTAATAKYTAITAHYSAITAHYSKVNAELTNALGFMTVLKQQ